MCDMANHRILVSGASGHLGRLVVARILETQDATNVIAVTRDPSKLAELTAKGVEVRKGAFDDDPRTLAHAFRGASRVLLISTDALDDRGTRLKQHTNAVAAV